MRIDEPAIRDKQLLATTRDSKPRTSATTQVPFAGDRTEISLFSQLLAPADAQRLNRLRRDVAREIYRVPAPILSRDIVEFHLAA